ncbi:holo-ACP synthase [Helicobacter marmotae]|uniref:Holo-[acyl-carrier-protein] synthase n=1 Tax=Helicobacter marmotae TaxID=152490 RepID=A0A3D8I736_9HELI|nr:holo-ACP synthase [Helicobacter marmotae]RDU60969.1 holo-ACP synthase [Helicobacter marmotae]
MIGIDIISIKRIQAFVEKFGLLGLRRFLRDDEIALCLKQPCNLSDKSFNIAYLNIARIAGFWAAKEACAKALGVGIGGELGFLDIHISKDVRNAPHITLTDEKMAYFGLSAIGLSISHDSGFAVAAVLCRAF